MQSAKHEGRETSQGAATVIQARHDGGLVRTGSGEAVEVVRPWRWQQADRFTWAEPVGFAVQLGQVN